MRGSSELVASGRHVRFAAFLFGSSRNNCSSASARTEACLYQDHTFRCRPCQATSVLHEQFAVPLDFVRGFLLNDLRRPSRAAPLLSPCGSAPSCRATASRALSSAPASSPTASSTPPHTCACAFQHRELRAQARADRSTSRHRYRIRTRTPARHCLACRATAPPFPAVGHTPQVPPRCPAPSRRRASSCTSPPAPSARVPLNTCPHRQLPYPIVCTLAPPARRRAALPAAAAALFHTNVASAARRTA
jgi:hypothetical protein